MRVIIAPIAQTRAETVVAFPSRGLRGAIQEFDDDVKEFPQSSG
jgi:hypothetical protein